MRWGVRKASNEKKDKKPHKALATVAVAGAVVGSIFAARALANKGDLSITDPNNLSFVAKGKDFFVAADSADMFEMTIKMLNAKS